MKLIRTLILAGAAGLAFASNASATDLYSSVASSPAYGPAGFDWEGFYFGVQKDWWIGEQALGFEAVAGVNFMLTERLLGGVEAKGGVISNFSDPIDLDAYMRGRLGFLVSDDVLLYKVIEVGTVGGTGVWGLGGGLEFAMGDSMSARGEFRGVGELGTPLSEAVASIGLLWHMD